MTLPDNLFPLSCPRDCGGGCPMVAEQGPGGRILRIKDNPLRPDKDIRMCPKGARASDEALSDQRLTSPLKRSGERGSGDFQDLNWNDALDEIAERLLRFRERYGSEAMMLLGGSGSCRGKVHSPGALSRRFFAHWGRINTTKGYYSDTAERFAGLSVFGGAGSGQDAETLEGTELVVLWGANICDLRYGPKLEPVLRRLKRKGVPFYVIDPRKTRTVRAFTKASPDTADETDSRWLAIRPGGDGALMAGVLHYWINEGLTDEDFIGKYTEGFEPLREWILGRSDGIPKDPAWAAKFSGLPVEQIRSFARAYGMAHPAALVTGLSIQRCLGGEESVRMAMALQAASGNTGIPGGTAGSCLWGSMPGPEAPSPSVFLPSPEARYGADLSPVNRWQDAFLEKDLMGIYAAGSNYTNQSSDQKKTLAAFAGSRLTVCHEMFLTGSALWSDYVLPVSHFLERYDIVGGNENYIFYSAKVLDPPGEAKDDLWIFSELAVRLGFGKSFHACLDAEGWVEACIRRSAVSDGDAFRACGFFDGGKHKRIALADFIADPASHPLPTPGGKINFHCSENMDYGFPSHPHFRNSGETGKTGTEDMGAFDLLQLLTPHAAFRINSQHAQLSWSLKKEFPALHLHPDDAALRGIREGMDIRVENDEGAVILPAVISDTVRKGVVWGFQGNWKLEDSLNRLSSTDSTMPSFGSRTHSILVRVRRAVERDEAEDGTGRGKVLRPHGKDDRE